jgi:hypothetical protein
MGTRERGWITPELVVLSRGDAQESVLVVCKIVGQGVVSQMINDTACTFDSVVTGICSECAATFAS